MTGKRIGYIRVSTVDQNPERQLDECKLDKKFIDYASAKSADRPQLQMMLDFIREDDLVIVHSMDRLARNLKDLKNIVDLIVSKNAEIQFVKERLSFTGDRSPSSNLILHLMGAFAEFEHSFIRDRQAEGIAIAKKRGRFKGTKKKIEGLKIEDLKQAMQTRKSKAEIAREFGVSRCTLYRYLKEIEKSQCEA